MGHMYLRTEGSKLSTDSSALVWQPRGVPVTPELRARLRQHAWLTPGRNASDIVREAIDEAIQRETEYSWGGDTGTGHVRLNFYISDEAWEGAKAAAHRNQISLASFLRVAIIRKMEHDEASS